MLKNFFPQHDFKGLLFDFDGTIADTMGAHLRAWNIGLQPFNLTLSREQHQAWAGRPTRNIVQLINEMHNVQIHADDFLREKEVHYFSTIHEVKTIASVMEVIHHYHGQMPMAVVTGSRRKAVETTMNHLGIGKYFDELICAEDYKNGKPAPDCFLLGASRIKVAAHECLAFEDALLGIQAARNANMECLRVDEAQKLVLIKD